MLSRTPSLLWLLQNPIVLMIVRKMSRIKVRKLCLVIDDSCNSYYLIYVENSIYIKVPVLILWEKCHIGTSVTENISRKVFMSSLSADVVLFCWAGEPTRPNSALRMIFVLLNCPEKEL